MNAPLPAGWCLATGADLFSYVTSGSRGWKQYYSDSGAQFVRVGNLRRDRPLLDQTDLQHVRVPGNAEGARTKVQDGDVLISITADLGRVAVADGIGDAYVNQHVALARPFVGLCSDILGWFLLSPQGQTELTINDRGATRAGLGLEDIRSIVVPLPPLAEQRRIVRQIRVLTARSGLVRQALAGLPALLERYRAATLAAAFRGDLTAEWRDSRSDMVLPESRMPPSPPPTSGRGGGRSLIDPDELPAIPEAWRWDWLGNLVTSSQNGLSKRSGQGGPVNVLRLTDIVDGEIRATEPRAIGLSEQEKRKYLLQHGDLVFVRVNGSADYVGRALVFNRQDEWAFCDHFIRMRIDEAKVLPDFLAAFFGSTLVRRLIEQSFVSSAGQKTVSQGTLFAIPVPIPPVDEQQMILRALRSCCDTEQSLRGGATGQLDRLAAFEAAVLAKAFRGELVPQNPSDEPASVLLDRIRAQRAASGSRTHKRGRSGTPV